MTDEESTRRTVEAVWRIEAARIVATLTRTTGDFALAEDLAQEAFAEALRSWPRDGVPRNPAAWLTTVAKWRAVDQWRRAVRHRDSLSELAFGIANRAEEPPWDPDAIDDDVLRLVFTACHPVLSTQARVALTLRVVVGLTTEEIAAVLLTTVPTVQQRIVRAKRTLGDAGVLFETPPREEYASRLGAVLGVIYLLFTEGHSASHGQTWMRTDLAAEAVRLGRVLAALVPDVGEVHGLLALMELTAARFPARLDAGGEPVLLEDQDRRRWRAPATSPRLGRCGASWASCPVPAGRDGAGN